MGKLFITAVITAIVLIAGNYAEFHFVTHDWKTCNNISLGILIGTAGLFLALLISGQYDQDVYLGNGSGDSGL